MQLRMAQVELLPLVQSQFTKRWMKCLRCFLFEAANHITKLDERLLDWFVFRLNVGCTGRNLKTRGKALRQETLLEEKTSHNTHRPRKNRFVSVQRPDHDLRQVIQNLGQRPIPDGPHLATNQALHITTQVIKSVIVDRSSVRYEMGFDGHDPLAFSIRKANRLMRWAR